MFDIKTSKKRFDANKVQLIEGSGHPYVVRTSQNNGVRGFLDESDEFLNPGNTLSFGQDTATIYYQESPYFTGDKVKILYPKNNLFSKKNAQFFVAALNQSFSSFEWGVGSHGVAVIESQPVKLPVSNGEVDFGFIESFLAELEAAHLAELEAAHLAELEAYLEASGLDNYELSVEEKKLISEFDSLEWGEFLVKDIFQKVSVKKVPKNCVRKFKDEQYSTPVVYCKFGDNGIMYWGRSEDVDARENIISVVYNGAIAAGKIYAQKEPTGILAESYFISHVQKPDDHEVNLFLSMSLEKVLYPKYSRDYLATWTGRVEDEIIILPIHSVAEIDYRSIHILISAVKKIVIKEVIDFARNKSAATRQAIES